MNEELKIIITAVTTEAKKGIQGVKKELAGVQGSAKGASKGIGAAFKGVGVAAGIAIGAIVAVGAALVKLGKASLDVQKTQAKLNTAFLSVGSSAQQAAESYKNLYRFLGDEDKSVEAAAHLAKLTTNQQELAEWTRICQGIYATFGDSLPIEGLTEAANETARVGKVTGTMADALNWAGVSEDEFNAKLAQTVSFEEREALIRSTLNDLYKDASDLYEKNNKSLLEYNESQARLNESLTRTGAVITPLLTALNNLSAVLLDALKPALDVIIPAITTLVNWITKGVEAILSFFGVITGNKASVKTFAEVGTGIGNAATGADKLTGGLENAAQAAEKVKRATMGFDELNIVSSGTSSSSNGTGSGGSSEPGYMTPTIDASKFTVEVEQTEDKASGFATLMKKLGDELKDVFAPTISAWTSGFDTIKESWNNAKQDFVDGAEGIKNSFVNLGSYVLGTFVPDLVNSFSVNLAPTITDIFGFAVEEAGKTFKLFGEIVDDATTTLLIPALESLKGMYEDMMEAWGNAWEEKGQPLLDEMSEAFDGLRSTVKTLYEEFLKPTIDKIIKVLDEAWNESLGPVFEDIVEALLDIGTNLMKLYNEFIKPIVDWIIEKVIDYLGPKLEEFFEFVGELIEDIGAVIGGLVKVLQGLVQFITGVFTGDWELAWTGIETTFTGVWDAITAAVEAAWETIKYVFKLEKVKAFFDGVWAEIKAAFKDPKGWFEEKFEEAKTAVEDAWDGVSGFFEDVWDEIQEAFKATKEFFKEKFGGAWDEVEKAWKDPKSFFKQKWEDIKTVFAPVKEWFKEKFEGAWKNIKTAFSKDKVVKFFKDVWNDIKSVFKNVGGTIGEAVSGAFKTAVNWVLQKAIGIINGFIDSINFAIGIINKIPGVEISKITRLEVPQLARGGIVDRATLAMIGERGKEAVVPLENNTEWIDKLVDRLTSRENAPSKIVLMLDGKELGWATLNSINNITRQTGALQLVMA